MFREAGKGVSTIDGFYRRLVRKQQRSLFSDRLHPSTGRWIWTSKHPPLVLYEVQESHQKRPSFRTVRNGSRFRHGRISQINDRQSTTNQLTTGRLHRFEVSIRIPRQAGHYTGKTTND